MPNPSQQKTDIEQQASSTNLPSSPPITKKNKRRRFLFWSGLILIITPPVALSSWLSSKGIQLNSLSGISVKNGLAAENVAISIGETHINLKNLSVGRRVDAQTGTASYHVMAVKTSVELPPATKRMLQKQNVKLNYIHVYDADLTFTDFSLPLHFSAHARKITTSALHTNSVSGWPNAVQILEDVNLNFSPSPHIGLSGTVRKGVITLFFPHYNPSPHYRLPFKKANFSIALQPDSIPLKIKIGALEPRWDTLDSILDQQIISKVAFAIDFKRPLDSMVLTARKLHIEEPKYLPSFVKRADINNKGYHLGQTLANLAQLPMQKFRVKSFTYGDLIQDAKILLETPTHDDDNHGHGVAQAAPHAVNAVPQSTKDAWSEKAKQQAKDLNIEEETITKARFIVRGKALAPNPYDLDVSVRHLTKTDARVHANLSRADGNTLDCDSIILFKQPLPKYLNCNANFKDTKEFTDRIGLTDLPDAKINGPLRFWANQTDAPTDAPQHQAMLVDNKLATAFYNIGFELPQSFAIALNKFALPEGLFNQENATPAKLNKTHITDVDMHSDGKIDFNVNFYDDLLRIVLKDDSEKIRFINKQTQSSIGFDFKALNCLYPNLQCHVDANIEAKANTLYPMPKSAIHDVTFQSKIVATWANNLLIAQMANNEITMKNVDVRSIPSLKKSQGKNIKFTLDSLVGLYTQNKTTNVGNITLYQPAKTNASLTSKFEVDRQESRNNEKKKKVTSLERYLANLVVNVNDFYLSQDIALMTEDTPTTPEESVAHTPTDLHIPVGVINAKRLQDVSFGVGKKLSLQVAAITGVDRYHQLTQAADILTPWLMEDEIQQIKANAQAKEAARIAQLKQNIQPLKPLVIRSNYGITFSAQRNKQALGKIHHNGDVSLHGDQLNINGTFTNSNAALLAKVQLESNFKQEHATLKLQRHTFNFSPAHDLKYYIPVLPFDMNVTKGELTTSAIFNIDKHANISGSANIESRGITGHYQQFRFGNVTSDISLAMVNKDIRTTAPMKVCADYLDVGVPLSDLLVNITLDTHKKQYVVTHGSTKLYGGTLDIAPTTINSFANIHTIPITLSGIDLVRLMAEINQEDIELTGKLDGVIPVSLQDGNVVIQGAKLSTRQPGGRLRYTPNGSIGQKVAQAGEFSPLNIAKVMENYHYNSLDFAFDYAKNGDLSFHTAIKGQNPQFQHGRPIHLTIKLNENIPNLLTSKQMIDSSHLIAQIKKQLGIKD